MTKETKKQTTEPENEQGAENEIQEAPKNASPQPPQDPYAALPPEERMAAKVLDAVLDGIPPSQRLATYQLGADRREQLAKEQELAGAKEDVKEAKAEGADKSEIRELTDTVKRLERELHEERDNRKRQRSSEEFRQTFSQQMASDPAFRTNPAAQKLVMKAVAGALVEHKAQYGEKVPFDSSAAIAASMNELREIVKGGSGQNAAAWVEQKLQDAAETAGEAGGGATPTRKQWDVNKSGSMDSGDFKEEVLKEYFPSAT